jgi:hypothetical protein
MPDDALFVPDGDRFVPTPLARGPWSPDALHGGPPAALVARCCERAPGGDGMRLVRLTVELVRPVPAAPLDVVTRLARPGKKVQLVEASVRAGDVEVVRAVGLRMRRAELPLPADLPRDVSPPPPDAGAANAPPWSDADWRPAFHSDAVEHRFVRGGFHVPGPAVDWIRLRVPLVAGEPTSPACRAVAAADFGNGVSWVLQRADGWQFINPDLTVTLHREPEGEWICLEAVTRPEADGIGMAESRLWDVCGAVGRAVQTLLLERSR